MSLEFEIKMILDRNGISNQEKANRICKFMTWNKEKLISKMDAIGTSSDENQSHIIECFWGQKGRRW